METYFDYGYIKQELNYTCGPTALYNVLIWSDYIPSNVIRFNELKKVCECRKPFGTLYTNFLKGIGEIEKRTDLNFEEIYPNFSNIKDNISIGKSIIVLFRWTDFEGQYGYHYIFIFDVVNNGVLVANNNERVEYIDNRKMRRYLRPETRIGNGLTPVNNIFPKMWSVSK